MHIEFKLLMIMVIPYSNLNPAELWMANIVWSHLCLCDLEEGGAKVSQVGAKEKRDRRIPKHWLVCFIVCYVIVATIDIVTVTGIGNGNSIRVTHDVTTHFVN